MSEMMCATHNVTMESCRLDRRQGCRYSSSATRWVVHWRSSRTDRTGVSDQRFTKEGAEQWAAELNARPQNKQIHHWAEEVKA